MLISIRPTPLSGGYVLASCLLGDVADGGSLLADDGADVLRGYQQSQGDVGVRRLTRHPGARGAAVRATPGSVAGASAVLLPPLAALQLRVLVGDVGDAQRVVLQLVPIELLDGSEAEACFANFRSCSRVLIQRVSRVFRSNVCSQCNFSGIKSINQSV